MRLLSLAMISEFKKRNKKKLNSIKKKNPKRIKMTVQTKFQIPIRAVKVRKIKRNESTVSSSPSPQKIQIAYRVN